MRSPHLEKISKVDCISLCNSSFTDPYISLSNILLKFDNQNMDLGPSLHLNTGTIVDISNFEG